MGFENVTLGSLPGVFLGMWLMDLKTGYVYHIKNEYFEQAQDNMLMRNHERGNLRPTYYCIQDQRNDLLWMIPMSSKIDKYQSIIDKDTARYKRCHKIIIGDSGAGKSAFLIQNCFPVLPKYIDHVHTVSGNALSLNPPLQEKIRSMFNEARTMHSRGVKVIFTDINRLEKLMLQELQNKEK